MSLRFRFAPTPSRELHVGNALAALFGWAKARAAGGRFVLRIEDIDRARSRSAFEEQIYRDLAWLGLDWDEGPDVGGPFAPYRQSERLGLYDRTLDALVAARLAYPCACSRADIRAAQSAPHHPTTGGEPAELPYPGTCRDKALVLPPDRGGLRLDLAALGDTAVSWRDGELGPQREEVAETAGDVLLGRHGQPTYQLAVVVDDRAMAVSDVVRGRDLLGSTGRQILIHRALARLDDVAEAPPRFHHHPLLTGADGRKLSKRDEAPTLASLAVATDPAALRAHLGRAIGLFGRAVRRAAMRDWIDAMGAHGALHDAPWPAVLAGC
jgi:glutamyl-tRNA synthetase